MKNGESQIARVLIVEDNQDDRDLLIRQLAKINIESYVKFIADGKEALRFLNTLNPTSAPEDIIAIFLDLKLPSMGGLELLRQIKSQQHLQEIPVFIMTSSLNPKDMEECYRLKANSFIPKPITFDVFTKAVADVFHLPLI